MYHDGADIAQTVMPPDTVVQIVVEQQCVRPVRHIEQQGVLRGGKLNLPPPQEHLPPDRVHLKLPKAAQLPGAVSVRLVPVHVVAADVGGHPGQQLVILDGLDDIIVPPAAQSGDDGAAVIQTAGENNWAARGQTGLPAEGLPPQIRNHYIQQDKVKILLGKQLHGIAARAGDVGAISGALQMNLRNTGQIQVVLHNQNMVQSLHPR
ncbi:hypothetical protein SDC9_125769 [bioreactor metagenome]|uniref:Uncharacterized protein n=1 Tax=bioreactor metagenome TaxID=1076179 RepID=A0A645CPD3_9ZZZZ